MPDYQPILSSPDAERAILGLIILDHELITQAKRLLQPIDFNTVQYNLVYIAMLSLDEKGKPLDPISINHALGSKGSKIVGGSSEITNFAYGLPHSTNIKHYAEIVREFSKSRWLLKFADKIKASINDRGENSNEIAKWIIDEVQGVDERLDDLSEPKSIDQLYADQELRYLMFHKGVSDAIPTGFAAVDRHLLGGGLVPSFFYILAGRPSMGKTTLGLDMAANMAEAGYRVMIVTREMQREVLIDRFVSAKSGVERFKIQSGMSKRDYERVLEGLSTLRLSKLVFDHSSTSIEEVDHWLGVFEKRGEHVDALIIDYLQLLVGDKSGNRTGEVADVSRGAKDIAMRRNIPVLGISQLTRAPGRENREPELYDLRESGQLEQDADFVGFLHGDDTEEGVKFMEKLFLCKKQREGPHFREPLDMNAELVTFRTLAMLGLGLKECKVIERPGDKKNSEKKLLQSKTRGTQRSLQEPSIDDQDI